MSRNRTSENKTKTANASADARASGSGKRQTPRVWRHRIAGVGDAVYRYDVHDDVKRAGRELAHALRSTPCYAAFPALAGLAAEFEQAVSKETANEILVRLYNLADEARIWIEPFSAGLETNGL